MNSMQGSATLASKPSAALASRIAFEFSPIPFVLLLSEFISVRSAVFTLAVVTLLVCFAEYMLHGGSAITSFGIAYLSTAIFGGFGSLLLFVMDQPIELHDLDALILVYFTMVAIGALGWKRGLAYPPIPDLSRGTYPKAFYFLGPALLLSGVLLQRLPMDVGPTVELLVYVGAVVGVVMVFEAAFTTMPWRKIALWAAILLPASFYAFDLFGGNGRLNIATLGLCVPLLWSRKPGKPSQLPKLGVVLVLPIAMIWGSYIGSTRSALDSRPQPLGSFIGSSAPLEGTGLDSVMSPIQAFGDLLNLSSSEDKLAFGRTFVIAALAWVPGDIWPDKPPGFGRELVDVLLPNLNASEGHSIAALAHGEWYYNFGLLGLLLMIPAVAAAIAAVDRGFNRVLATATSTRLSVLKRSALVVLIVGIPDYIWVGSFTYMARGGFRALTLAALIVVSERLFGAKERLSFKTRPAVSTGRKFASSESRQELDMLDGEPQDTRS